MNATTSAAPRSTPWHLWVVGILSLLWNASGAVTIWLAQLGKLTDISPEEAAYYAAQATWFVVVTNVALIGSLLAAIALLARSRWAVTLFGIALVAILATNLYDLAAGTSRMMTNTDTIVVTVLIWMLAVAQLWYAWAMRKRGVLR